jgi:hypothetical protein
MNGAVVNTTTNISGDIGYGSIHATTIGADFALAPASEFFPGTTDDVRIYSRALSASEVAALYSQGQTKITSASNLAEGTTLANGLIGYWPLDASSNNWTTDTTLDMSGQGKNGSLFYLSTTTSPIAGKIGQAMWFNGLYNSPGSQDCNLITVADGGGLCKFPANQDFTASVWIRETPAESTHYYQEVVGDVHWDSWIGWAIFIGGYTDLNTAYLETDDGSPGTGAAISTTKLIDGRWHLLTAKREGNNNYMYIDGKLEATTNVTSVDMSSDVHGLGIGDGPSSNITFPFAGRADEVRIYNRALSDVEIKQLYNLGQATQNSSSVNLQHGSSLASGLVGLWTFEGPDVTDKIYDRSSQGNNGYFIGGSTSSAKTIGKLGQALQFTGSNYITARSSPSLEIGGTQVSVFAWVKPSIAQLNADPTIVSKNFLTDDYQLGLDAPGSVLHVRSCFNSNCFIGNNTVPFNTWSLVGVTYDGSNVRTYINGVLDSTNALTGSLPTNSSDLLAIGATSGAPNYTFIGATDDVRVYSRALSANEVNQLYNMGK